MENNPDPNNQNQDSTTTPYASPKPSLSMTDVGALSTVPSQPEVPTEQPVAASPPPSGNSKKSKTALLVTGLLLFAILGSAVSGYIGYTTATAKAEKREKALASQLQLASSTDYAIPAGAVKVSECIPGMGAHYLMKGGDKEYGPFILVSKQEKVLGVEFMPSTDMFKAIPSTDPPVSVVLKDSPMLGWKFDHAEFSSLPKGHEGLERSHIDAHLFTVKADVLKDACK